MQCIALDIVAPNVQGSSMKRRRSCPCFHAETPAEEEEHVKAQGWAERVDDSDAWPLADSIVNSQTMPYAGGGEPSDGGEADPPGEAEEQETESDDVDNGERKRPVQLARCHREPDHRLAMPWFGPFRMCGGTSLGVE